MKYFRKSGISIFKRSPSFWS